MQFLPRVYLATSRSEASSASIVPSRFAEDRWLGLQALLFGPGRVFGLRIVRPTILHRSIKADVSASA